jgi:tyrosine-specific transport protein
MAGVIVTYFLFVVVAAPHVDFSLLAHSDWSSIWSSLSVIFVMFGFQNVVPTLYNYMERDHKKLRKAIWIGSSIPLALYLIWELLILGTVPLENLSEALHEGQSAAIALQHTVEKGVISSIASFFALFAMSTSFAGISIAFFDFFADGLKWEKAGVKRFALVLLVFFIPLLFVFLNPAIFIQALRWGGGIGAILLFGILPVLDVWSGRYFHGHPLTHQFIRGGKWSLSLILVLSVLVLLSNL